MTLKQLKFNEEELAAKSVIALEDRPQLSAAEMKAKLDSGDIRERFNEAMDLLQEQCKRLFVFDTLDEAALLEIRQNNPDGRIFVIFLDRGETCFTTFEALERRLNG